MASIFISYRRADSAGLAGRLYDRLERQFRRQDLFIDIDSIQAGSDFTQTLDRTLALSRVVLVLIGPNWLDIRDAEGNRRLEDPGDFVRLEIEASLARDVVVVPVLLEDAVMPAASALPESLRPLARRQAVELRTRRFGPDCDDLVRTLKTLLKPAKSRSLVLPVAAALLLAASGIGFAAYRSLGPFARDEGLHERTDAAAPTPANAVRGDLAATGLPVQVSPTAQTLASLEQRRVDDAQVVEAARKAAEAQAQETRRVAAAKADEEAKAKAKAEEERARVASVVAPKPAAVARTPGPAGTPFQECETCPQMVTLPAGRFTIGSPASERGRNPDEGPQREVSIATPFAVSRYPVSFDDWDACLAEGGCNAHRPGDYNWGRGRNPVIFVSWADARAYAAWLSQKTGQVYRLLSEAEWEYAARGCAGPRCGGEAFWFGPITPEKANYDWRQSYEGSPKAQGERKTVAVDLGQPNGFGLVQMLGNVRHWVEDCWAASYDGMPGDGSPRLGGDCSRRVTRGGSWSDEPRALRAAARSWEISDARGRSAQIGIRVARVIAP